MAGTDNECIEKYLEERRATTESNRRVNIALHLKRLSPYIKNYRKATLSSITNALGDFREQEPDYEDNYRHAIGVSLKTFMRWMVKKRYNTAISLDEVKEIPLTPQIPITKTAQDMWTPEEVNKLLNACIHSRDKAFITVLYEGALRVGEALRLKWKDVSVNEGVVTLHISYKIGRKTKSVRTVPIILYKEHVTRWHADTPSKSPEDRVFIPLRKNYTFTYSAVRTLLKTVHEQSGVKKHLSAHILRHSGLTQKTIDGMNPVALSMIGWGRPLSKMLETYTHLSGGNVVSSAVGLYGVAQVQVKKEPKRAPQCSQCGIPTTPDMDFCPKCGNALTEEAMKAQQKKEEELFDRLMEYMDRKNKTK